LNREVVGIEIEDDGGTRKIQMQDLGKDIRTVK
jgi:hypothetical protein